MKRLPSKIVEEPPSDFQMPEKNDDAAECRGLFVTAGSTD